MVCFFCMIFTIDLCLARVLPAPDIKYRRGQREVIEQVRFGKWRVRNWFFEASTINSWGMIYFGDAPDRQTAQDLEQFRIQLPEVKFHFLMMMVYEISSSASST